MKSSRRQFFGKFLSAAASGPLLASRLASNADQRIQVGYATITWGKKFDQALEEISALGYRGIQYRAPDYERYRDRLAELQEKLAGLKLTPVAMSSGSVDLRPEERQKFVDRVTAHARFQKQLGGLYLQVTDDVRTKNPGLPDAHKKLAEFLNELGRRVADEGVRMGYHAHYGTLGQSREDCGRIFDASDPKVVGLILDTAHLARGGADPVEVFQTYGSRLLFPHFKDLYTGPPRESADEEGKRKSVVFTEMGQGKVDFRGVLAAMRKHNFRGWIIVELDGNDLEARSPRSSAGINRKYLEDVLRLPV